MITITVTSHGETNLYGRMIKKEIELRKRNIGTLHAKGAKKKNEEKWVHSKYDGWIRFSGSLGGALVAVIRSRNPDAEGDLMTSFIGFVHRHFSEDIIGISITYSGEG